MRGIIIVNGFHRYIHPRQFESVFPAFCQMADLKIYQTEFPGHARHIAASAAKIGAEVVVAVGGDGTLNEVINGVAGTPTAVAILPCGTANDFAYYMHINKDSMLMVTDLSACWTRHVDLIRVNGWYYVTVGGLGFGCDTLKRAELLKHDKSWVGHIFRSAGPLTYLMAFASLFGSLSRSQGRIKVETEHQQITCNPLSVIVANQPKVGYLFSVAPRAVNNDGMCDLFIINHSSHKNRMVRAVTQTCVPGLSEPNNIIRLQSKRLTITSDQPTNFFGDGEIRLEENRFDIEVIPHALRVLIPPILTTEKQFSQCNNRLTTPKSNCRLRPMLIPRMRT